MAESGKKILVILGSPRKSGNSAALANQIAKGATEAGAQVETLYLNGMDIKPCQSCYACQKKGSKGCAVDDDMQSVFPRLIEADAWVIASPVYWFTMSAQTKLFMDRLFALPAYDKKAFGRVKTAIAMSYGDADPFVSGCVNALRTFQDAFAYTGTKIAGMVYGSGMEPGDISANQALMKDAEDLGRKLALED